MKLWPNPAIIVLASTIFACSSQEGNEATQSNAESTQVRDDKIEPLLVKIEIDKEISTDGKMRIVGTTNLPNRTVLTVSARRDDIGYFRQSRASVVRGEIRSEWFSVGGDAFPPGDYEIGVTVPSFHWQPTGVKRALGDLLGRMTGPLVKADSTLGNAASVDTVVRVEALPEPVQSSREVIGKWLDKRGTYWEATITIYLENEVLRLHYSFHDGSEMIRELTERPFRGQRLFADVEIDRGEYCVIDPQGHLGIYDRDGLIATAKINKIKKSQPRVATV